MPNHYSAKTRAILADASVAAQELQAKAAKLLEEGKIEEETMLFLEQDAIRNKILAAHGYAILSLGIEEPRSEAPQEPSTPESDLPFDVTDPLGAIDAVFGLLRAFTPRPVKDTPQA